MVNEAEEKLKTAQEYVRFLTDWVTEQSNQLLEEFASSSGYRKQVVFVEQEFASVSADVKRPTARHTADSDLLDGILKALAPTRQLNSSMPRRIPKIVKSYWLLEQLSKPSSASFGQTCEPKLLGSRGLLTTRWHVLMPLIVDASGFLSLRAVLSFNSS